MKRNELVLRFENAFNRQLTHRENSRLETLCSEYSKDEILNALEISTTNGVFNLRYITTVLKESKTSKESIALDNLKQELNVDVFKNELRQLTTPIIYDTWFKDMEYIGTDNNNIIFKVPMRVHQDYITNHYEKLVRDIITNITREEYKIKFIY